MSFLGGFLKKVFYFIQTVKTFSIHKLIGGVKILNGYSLVCSQSVAHIKDSVWPNGGSGDKNKSGDSGRRVRTAFLAVYK